MSFAEFKQETKSNDRILRVEVDTQYCSVTETEAYYKADLSNGQNLLWLGLHDFKFKSLDLSACKSLTVLHLVRNHQMTELDISHNKQLNRLNLNCCVGIKNLRVGFDNSLNQVELSSCFSLREDQVHALVDCLVQAKKTFGYLSITGTTPVPFTESFKDMIEILKERSWTVIIPKLL